MTSFLIGMALCLMGGLGAVTRFVLDTAVKQPWSRLPNNADKHTATVHAFPLSTLVVNIAACLLAGIVAAAFVYHGAPSSPWRLVLATGFLGGFSTFSTAINESVTLLRNGKHAVAVANIVLEYVVPLLCVALGWWLAAAL
ncbi:fluoride efflux transporter FluC [Bifidobacterium apri]|uniref:fluoride efflux transporter FluC n=1 Tax=Bifidobacterium apri TaxID=1769423 RepID=UPI00399576A5